MNKTSKLIKWAALSFLVYPLAAICLLGCAHVKEQDKLTSPPSVLKASPVLNSKHNPSKRTVASHPVATKNGKTKTLLARVTYYYQKGSGTDRWTAAGQTSTGKPLVNKKVAAIDPKVIPYGSKIDLPNMNMKVEAVDTGSAVKSKKAALAWGKNVPVIDIFVTHKAEAMKLAANNPMFQEVVVHYPSTLIQ